MAGIWIHGSLGAALALAAMTAASACAPDGLRLQCTVTGADKLPSPLTQDEICRTFASAMADAIGSKVNRVDVLGDRDQAPGDWARLDIAVRNQYGIVANLRHGRGGEVHVVPAIELSISDRALSQRQIDQIARAVAGELAKP